MMMRRRYRAAGWWATLAGALLLAGPLGAMPRRGYFDLVALEYDLSGGRGFDDNIYRVAAGGLRDYDNLSSLNLELRPEIAVQGAVKLKLGYSFQLEDYDRSGSLDNCLNVFMISGGKKLWSGRARFSVAEEWQLRRAASPYYKYNVQNIVAKGELLPDAPWKLFGRFRNRFLEYISEIGDYYGRTNYADNFTLGLTRYLRGRDRITLAGEMGFKTFNHYVVIFDTGGGYHAGQDLRQEDYRELQLTVESYIYESLLLSCYGALGGNNSNNLGFDYDDGRWGLALISERKAQGAVLMVVTLACQRYERNYRERVPRVPVLLEDIFGEEEDQNFITASLMKYLNDSLSIAARYSWIERTSLDYLSDYRKNVMSLTMGYSR